MSEIVKNLAQFVLDFSLNWAYHVRYSRGGGRDGYKAVRKGMTKVCFFLASCLALGYGAFSAGDQVKPKKLREKIDFNRDIRPILANKCLNCHGNDKKSIQAGLHLDTRAGATKKLPSGAVAIKPGDPDGSWMLSRVLAEEPMLRMPPPSSNKTVSAEEKALLRQWIAEGAEYKEHWAFVPPVRSPLPKIKLTTWPKNQIDHYILAQIEKNGLKPSPQADRASMIRRVTLDLTGLPPTTAEIDDFLKDTSPQAYEKVVDRLLASPRYGERMAMDWMDYARYADSNGYQADYERFQWRWRDWVIDAFNKNMPFDQFTIEQLAGDLLPNPTLDQRIATGFNRNHRINTEGGVIPEEWRVETVIDRVETTTTTWLGLTAGCARCHDHKYDPISQKEFYQLYAYFNNVPESGTGEERPVNHPPFIKAPSPQQQSRMSELQVKVQALRQSLTERIDKSAGQAANWRLETPPPPASMAQGVAAEYAFAAETTVQGSAPKPVKVGAPKFNPGRSSGAVAVSGENYLDLGNAGDFDTKDSFSYGVWVMPENGGYGAPVSRMDSGKNFQGWDLYLAEGRPMVHIIHNWPENAVKVISKTPIPNRQWSHITVSYDGSSKAAGVRIYVNGKPVETTVEADKLAGSVRTPVSTKVGRRTNSDVFAGQVDDLVIFNRVATSAEAAYLASVHPAKSILATSPASRTPEQKQTLTRLWLLEHDPEFQKADAEVATAENERRKVDEQIPTLMVMEEMAKPRQAYILERGLYDKHGAKVYAGLPAVLPRLPKGQPNNRLGLARWIVSPDNPLTARVVVNRYWERFFGTGIVSTVEDFGTRAEFPSHPELLDWLATEYVRLGWDNKAIIKKIVMSATYRQSSTIPAKLLAVDPANRLLARGPRFRLPAEVIRDQAMFVSGLLHEKVGGPSVRPYQPEGIWDETNVYGNLRNYKHDMGEGLHRRSLYTIWKRTAAPPNMTLFDVSSRETCRVIRPRTNTPLQALALLNDVTYVEAARVLAQNMLRVGGPTVESRIEFAYRQVLSRRPSAQETQILRTSLAKRIDYFKANPKAAQSLISTGDAPLDKNLDSAELAAYTLAASTLLNLDETITKE